MTDKELAPLSAACVRALNDKLYEKRKTAAQEIEKMVKDFVAVNNSMQLKKLFKLLGQDFAMSHNPHSRKGGLIGLAAMAIGLGPHSYRYIEELVRPILACLKDSDIRVRYYACEALYNVVKVARGSVLPYFNEIFDCLSKLAADPDQNVKNGSELLDRLMKDIVTESSSFDLVAFVPLLRERMYTKNAFARKFIVSWVLVLDAVPDVDMLVLLPEILDGLFEILGDPVIEIKSTCETVLGEFLKNIKKNPTKVNYSAMINILIVHSQSPDETLQRTALQWIEEFVNLSQSTMLPYTSGILTAVLPAMSYDDESRRNVRDVAKRINVALMALITPEEDDDENENSKVGEEVKENEKTNNGSGDDNTKKLDLAPVVDVLTRQLLHTSMQTKIGVLKWIYLFHRKMPNKIFAHVEEIFPVLLKTLSDPSDEVVILNLEVLAEISLSVAGKKSQCKIDTVLPDSVKDLQDSLKRLNSYFIKFMISLLQLFNTDQQLLEDRGSFIIRQLCLFLSAEDIYQTLAEILLHETDLKFASIMVQTLNTILLTSSELFELRNDLNTLSTEANCALFTCLYRSWCHNPVATVSLCLLTQNYKHACDLLQMFGELEVTVDFLTEIDKLVQLIESPIFTYLRLQLLDTENNYYLVKSLYGLLMLLPQSEAFRLLHHRLDCIPRGHLVPTQNLMQLKLDCTKWINFKQLLEHFHTIQLNRRQIRKIARAVDLERRVTDSLVVDKK